MRANVHWRPAKRTSGAAGVGGGCGGGRRGGGRAAPPPATRRATRRHMRAGPPRQSARAAPSGARSWFPLDDVEQQLLCAPEAGGDLERGQRLLLGVGRPVREQIALAQVAVRGGLVGGSG